MVGIGNLYPHVLWHTFLFVLLRNVLDESYRLCSAEPNGDKLFFY
jgi:hypothetical protein